MVGFNSIYYYCQLENRFLLILIKRGKNIEIFPRNWIRFHTTEGQGGIYRAEGSGISPKEEGGGVTTQYGWGGLLRPGGTIKDLSGDINQ